MSVEYQTLYLISKVEEVEGKELIKIYEAMGYTPQTIRNILSKLKKEYYLTSPSRSVYKITNVGKEFIKDIFLKENFYNKSWENDWYIVLIELPELYRKKRDDFRRRLLSLGFGLLYKSVYVSPWDKTNAVMSVVSKLEIEEYVTILNTKEFMFNKIRHAGSSGIHDPANIWNLDEINLNYTEKYNYFKQDLQPKIEEIASSGYINELKVFIYYLQINDLIHELVEKDPMLPPVFLPGNWMGTTVLSKLHKTSNELKKLLPKESIYHRFM